MPTPTYIALATTTLASSTASVTLSSIPSTYRDLVLIVNVPPIAGSELILLLNGATSDYSRVYGEYIYASVGAAADGGSQLPVGAYGADRATLICHIIDYSATDKHKPLLARGDSQTATKMTALRWANTAAVTSVLVKLNTENMPTGTTINLYGIAS
jgi:hypothetical protein